MKTTTLLLISCAVAALVNAADTGKTLYREGFDHYGDACGIFSEACSIAELPPSLKQLRFNPEKPGAVYTQNRKVPEADCRNFDFEFRFMFPARDGKRALEAELFTLVDGKSLQRYGVVIDEDRYAINPAPGAQLLEKIESKANEAILPALAPGQWREALVTVRGNTISLFVGDKVGRRKMASAEYNGAPLTAFNFRSATPFCLDDIVLRQHENRALPDFSVADGVSTATHNAEYAIDVPGRPAALSAEIRLGSYPGQMKIRLEGDAGEQRTISARIFPLKQKRTVKKDVAELVDGKLVTTAKYADEEVLLPDAGLALSCPPPSKGAKGWNLRWHARPLLQFRYAAPEAATIIANWERLPAASERFVQVEVRPAATGAEFWIDGKYGTTLNLTSALKRVVFVLPAGGAIRNPRSAPSGDARFLALDIARTARPGAMRNARIKGAPGDNVIEKIPFRMVDGADSADTGVCEENFGSYYLECDGYLQRSAFEGNLHSILFAVPVAQYIRAWALCAVEENPEKETEITARLTRFLYSGQGPAYADTTLILPRDGNPADARIKPVGKVELDGKSLPLYLVRFDMDVGAIQDLIFQTDGERLDFEFVGKLHDGDNFYMDMRRKPSLTKKSGVHIFGATLERAPFSFCVLPAREFSAYDPSMRATSQASITAERPGSCTLEWRVRDMDGNEIEKGSRRFKFSKAGEKAVHQVAYGQKQFGWYGVSFKLADDEGGEIRHDAAFALVDADKRKAGYESPYFIWNYGLTEVGDILKTLGVRRTLLGKRSEADVADYTLTLGQYPYLHTKGKTEAEVLAEFEPRIKELRAKYPHCNQALIFHESGGGPYPVEIFGEKTALTDEDIVRDREMTERAIVMAKAWRKLAPDVTLAVGNSGTSIRLLARLFRQKYPRELIDFTGDEGSGGSVPSERAVSGAFWSLRELARIYGYEGVEPTACYEWSTRRIRQNGPRKNAEYRIRDALVALAWNSRLVPLTTVCESPSAYFNTVWAEAALTRPPLLYPLPVFPAIATLTQVLDGAKFARLIPTGSATVYALEFVRGREFIYVLWTARGELDAKLSFAQEARVAVHGFYGAQSEARAPAGSLPLPVSEAPCYLTGTVPLRAVDGTGRRTFARERVPAQTTVAGAAASLDNWGLAEGPDRRLDNESLVPEILGGRRPGKFILQSVKDEEKGDCLELVHASAGTCPPMMSEYVMVTNARPTVIAGSFSTIGLWVRGNSSWGKIHWEIRDAEGETWISAGTAGYGCHVYDWADQAGINFDGWHLLQFPITKGSPIKVASPGHNELQWQHDGRGNHRIDFPVSFTGFGVAVPGQALNIKEMEPVKQNLRFGDVIIY